MCIYHIGCSRADESAALRHLVGFNVHYHSLLHMVCCWAWHSFYFSALFCVAFSVCCFAHSLLSERGPSLLPTLLLAQATNCAVVLLSVAVPVQSATERAMLSDCCCLTAVVYCCCCCCCCCVCAGLCCCEALQRVPQAAKLAATPRESVTALCCRY
jgi:hypothetical protein